MYIKYCMLAIPFFEAFLIMEYLFKAKITRITIVILFINTAIEDNPVGMPTGVTKNTKIYWQIHNTIADTPSINKSSKVAAIR